jgi:hypothetical protein
MIPSAPQLPPPKRKRRHRPVSVERDACLIRLGIDPARPWDMHHEPALARRPWSEEAGDYEPAENDPRYMVPMQKAAHQERTSTVDRPEIDKTRRAAEGQQEHRLRMLAKGGELTSDSASMDRSKKGSWPKGRKMQSRGFERRQER